MKNKCNWEVGVSTLFTDLRRAKSDVELVYVVREVKPLLGRLIFAELEEFQHLTVVTEVVRLEGQISRFTVAQTLV